MKVFVGIDTGTRKCGWAIVDMDGALVYSGVWVLKGKNVFEHLVDLRYHVVSIINNHVLLERNIVVGLEEPFVGIHGNRKTALKQAYAWGVLFNEFCTLTNYIYEISPVEAKLAMTSHSCASKEDMIAAAKIQFGVDCTEDEADAIGNALATRKKWLEQNADS